jgi:hypothetical protein
MQLALKDQESHLHNTSADHSHDVCVRNGMRSLLAGLVIGLIQGRVVTVSDQLLISDLSVEAYFGSDVSINQDYGVIGSLGDNDYAGET